MTDWLIINGVLLRLSCFVILFALLGIGEQYRPKRPLTVPKAARWLNNLAIVLLNNTLLKLLMPFLAIDAAIYAQQQHWGLIPALIGLYPDLTAAFTVIICILLLDAAIYLQHRLFHQIPLLWRLHRMHHSDLDIDVSTAIRFHPIEIILSMLIKIAVVITLGAPVAAVIIFELLLNLTAMFSHSNIRLPAKFDHYIRFLLVTPDMHRVHHSSNGSENNHNFGFCLPWWDRIFTSYQDQPQMGHLNMQIGLPYFRQQQECKIQRMLTQPFRQETK